MKTKSFLVSTASLAGSMALAQFAFAQGTAFTYQGRLNDTSAPANGSYDLRLILYNAEVGGSQVGAILTNSAVPVTAGLFNLTLDFGAGIFSGTSYFLEIAVRTNGNAAFITLSPRQPLTPSPYAIMANNASNLLGTLAVAQLSGAIPSSNLSGAYSNALTFNNPNNSFSGAGSNLTSLNASQLAVGTVADARLSANVALRNSTNTFVGNQSVTSGNVGINAVPVSRLHVNGPVLLQGGFTPTATSTTNMLNLAVGVSSNGFANGIGFYESVGAQAMGLGYDGTVPGTANNALRIYDNTGTPIFSFLHGGSMGIGTTAPASELHVKNGSDTEISIESSDPGGHRWTVQSSRVAGNTNVDASFQIIDRTLNSSRVLITTNGNVGIHNTAPGTTLDVNGTTTTSNLVVNGDALRTYGSALSRMHPIAYGNVTSTGSIDSGTANFSVTHSSGSGLYTINITGESYSFIAYSTIVTPIGLSAVIPATFSSSGALQVRLFDVSGAANDHDFNFVVYKPGSN